MLFEVKAINGITGDKVTLIVKVTGSKDVVKCIVEKEGVIVNNLNKDIKAIRCKEGVIYNSNKQ